MTLITKVSDLADVTGARGLSISDCITHPGLFAAVATFSTASKLSGASPKPNAPL